MTAAALREEFNSIEDKAAPILVKRQRSLPITSEDMLKLSTLLHEVCAILVQAEAQIDEASTEWQDVISVARDLKRKIHPVLASAGLDDSWSIHPSDAAPRNLLSERDSALLAERLENPPEPTDAMRFAIAQYLAASDR